MRQAFSTNDHQTSLIHNSDLKLFTDKGTKTAYKICYSKVYIPTIHPCATTNIQLELNIPANRIHQIHVIIFKRRFSIVFSFWGRTARQKHSLHTKIDFSEHKYIGAQNITKTSSNVYIRYKFTICIELVTQN